MSARATPRWEVVPFVPLTAASRARFTYLAGREMHLKPGMLVQIPFGPRLVSGLVWAEETTTERLSLRRMKTVARIVEERPLFTSAELHALEELAKTSLESLAMIVKTATLVRKPLLGKTLNATESLEHDSTARRSFNPLVSIAWTPIDAVLQGSIGGQTLILMPEIAIGEEIVRLLAERGLPVALFAQTHGVRERRHLLQRLRQGEPLTVVATHAGIFLPFTNLQRIIVAEAALASHRQWDMHPRYDARVGALLLARARSVPLILQSTLPSLDLSFLSHNANVQTTHSWTELTHPSFVITPRSTSDPFLGTSLLSVLREAVERKERVFLFHDIAGTERAYACGTCGHMLRCAHCGGMLERHVHTVRCRLCLAPGGTPPRFCPLCRSPHIGPRRIGTSSLELILKHLFPAVHITRLDRETLGRSAGNTIDVTSPLRTSTIAIGTERAFARLQRATFDRVIVLDADRMLEDHSFEATERVLGVLYRLAWYQRTNAPILFQTTHHHLSLLQALGSRKLELWLNQEEEERTLLQYPPATALYHLSRSFPTPTKAAHALERLTQTIAVRNRALTIGRHVTAGPTPRASAILRGHVADLQHALRDIPSGWTTDPQIPLNVLFKTQEMR